MSIPFRRAVGAIVLGAVLVLGGCTVSPSPPGPDPQRTVSDAVAATLAAGTARISADLGSPFGSVTASGPVRFTPFAADLSATVSGREFAVRTVDDRSWARLGSRWSPVAPGLVPVGALTGAVRAATALRDVTADGPDPAVVADGAPATRYRGTVDLDAAASADPAASGPLRELAALVTPRPGAEVWVGPDGRVAQLRLTPAGSAPVTVRLTEPGLPVEVSPPPT